MKKTMVSFLMFICLFGLTACSGNVDDVKIIESTSEIYTDAEIQSAIDVTINYFKQNFKGCTLTEITYLGDDKLENFQEYADLNNADDVIVLISSFETGAFGSNGSLNSFDTYNNWEWILTRTDNGEWVHFDHGY